MSRKSRWPGLEAGKAGDLVLRALEHVPLPHRDLAHRDQPVLQLDQLLELRPVRAVEDLALEVLDLVVDLVERLEEAVGEGIQDLVDDNALGCAGPAPQMLDQLLEHLAALVVQGHDVAAADHHAHLDRLEVAPGCSTDPEVDEQQVIVEGVEASAAETTPPDPVLRVARARADLPAAPDPLGRTRSGRARRTRRVAADRRCGHGPAPSATSIATQASHSARRDTV